MLHGFIILVAFVGAFTWVARSCPTAYLRCHEALAWAVHALWFGFVFGMGIIIGRYGFVEYTSAVVADWLATYGPLVTCCYVALLLYQTYLRTIAEQRQAYLQRDGAPASWRASVQSVEVFSRSA